MPADPIPSESCEKLLSANDVRLLSGRPLDLRTLERAWLEALDSVEPFVSSRPRVRAFGLRMRRA
jgi:hypothetical protein